jgi:phosphoribosylanthranilate isomerase
MARTRIKICGIRDLETALVAVEAGADALGFVFTPGSPRTIDPDPALDIAEYLPPFISRVALMVNPHPRQTKLLAGMFPFDVLQLHGAESADDVTKCRMACGASTVKAIRFDSGTIEQELELWGGVADIDALLIDGGAGGEGKTLPWDTLAPLVEDFPHPVILAGGLTPQNVGDAIAALHPYAVDVSSGVERSRGVKDPDLIWAFCAAVRRADAARDDTPSSPPTI